ncbi:UDP-N-acetylmuramoyl-L-alanine--D-glutamate ligase [Candidatus Nomurabacteria bacterium]|nr:UDP-N-acetylmuramoyl-L-alanine--D-glutamate ligase [Candidatus Nomurabacteria bacterium]
MLKQVNFKNKKVLILGLGVTGVSAFKYLQSRGAKVIVIDDLSADKLPADVLDLVQDCEAQFFGGEIPPDDLMTITDLLVVSPGVSSSHIVYKEALTQGVEIKNDINLFLDEWNCSNRVVGVTGSNGKSTIVSLLGHIMESCGIAHKVAGNLGNSPLDFLTENKLTGDEVIVLELSNYQLELFNSDYFVDIAVITNISNNHLTRYGGSIESYAEAKGNIIKSNHTSLIVEGDNEGIQKYILPIVKPKDLYKVSLSIKDYDASETGIYSDNDGNLVFRSSKGKNEIVFDNVSDRKLFGRHNLYNIGDAILVCKLLDINSGTVSEPIRNFEGLAHRIQFVAESNGIRFINDSKSTSPDATVKAVESLSNGKNIILIAGGVSKVDHYREWRKIFSENIRNTILLPGNASDQIIEEARVGNYVKVDNMQEAVSKAFESAKEGDVVLLSPGAGSQNLFKDFNERGTEFMKFVNVIIDNE